MLIDLTVPLHTAMPVWPGDPEVALTPAASVAADGYNLLALRLGSQSGTHVDAPYHVDDALPTLGELPLDRFTGRAVVADLRGLPAGAPITAAHLDPVADALGPGAVLLLATGWSAYWGTPAYADHPWLHPDAARRAVANGVRTVGIDAPSIDPSGTHPSGTDPSGINPSGTDPSGIDRFGTGSPGPPGPALPAHHVLAAAGAVIAENLTNLDALLRPPATDGDVVVWLLPLPLARADGSPVRAVAEIRPRGVS